MKHPGPQSNRCVPCACPKGGEDVASPTTKEEWLEYCAYEATPDAQRPNLSVEEIKALTPAQRSLYNDERVAFLEEERLFPTRDLTTVLALAHKLMRAARVKKFVARRGIRVSGNTRIGKSTAVMAAGKTLDCEMRRISGREADLSYLPVLYTPIATATSINKLWIRLADFVGAREIRGTDPDERLLDLAHLLKKLGTRFVILDEAQRLNTDRPAVAEVADAIKVFAETLDATMIFAGISLDTAPLFSGRSGEQWRKRTRPVNMSKYDIRRNGDLLEWQRLVAAWECLLPLPLHEPGLLERNAAYLLHRTDGSLALLSDLIVDAASAAIDSESEAITVELLDTIAVDDEDRGTMNHEP